VRTETKRDVFVPNKVWYAGAYAPAYQTVIHTK